MEPQSIGMKKTIASLILLACILLLAFRPAFHQCPSGINEDSLWISKHYDKAEYRIPMRDGARLFTVVYSPKDQSEKYPIILMRTPYSVGPYGESYRSSLGPDMIYAREKFIFVYQDVRGRFMSEGNFINMTPHKELKKKKTDVDESSDTWDTVDWLVRHVQNNNGKVGQWGISYPGFYTSAGGIDAHPALVAISPQAPIADWWFDDFHHHGAFFLPHTLNFFYIFGPPRYGLTTKWGKRLNHGTPDGYSFFLEKLGALGNVNPLIYHDTIPFWNQVIAHPDYDQFWQNMNILPHLQQMPAAVLTVGGWFDAEDLYGTLSTYKSIEKQDTACDNRIVMGPWSHGGWHRTDGTRLGKVFFTDDPKPSEYFLKHIEFPFFLYHLKGEGSIKGIPEASMFETGSNVWMQFDQWPPENTIERKLYFGSLGLQWVNPSSGEEEYDEFVSDIMHPVPYTEAVTTGMTKEYMTDDQRFASRRPDVLSYRSSPLPEDITMAGIIKVHLEVSTDHEDADWAVKIIDVYPDSAPPFPHRPGKKMGGYQQMVRSEVIRGRYRKSNEHPIPFNPGEITDIDLELQDVLHCFKKGHSIMVQVQSTWFPLVDRNPQKWVDNIYLARDTDFENATHRVYRSYDHPSYIVFNILH